MESYISRTHTNHLTPGPGECLIHKHCVVVSEKKVDTRYIQARKDSEVGEQGEVQGLVEVTDGRALVLPAYSVAHADGCPGGNLKGFTSAVGCGRGCGAGIRGRAGRGTVGLV